MLFYNVYAISFCAINIGKKENLKLVEHNILEKMIQMFSKKCFTILPPIPIFSVLGPPVGNQERIIAPFSAPYLPFHPHIPKHPDQPTERWRPTQTTRANGSPMPACPDPTTRSDEEDDDDDG